MDAMTDVPVLPLVWVVDSSRAALAGSMYAFETCADAHYFTADERVPLENGMPDAVFFSAEIDGGPGGESFRQLAASFSGVPLLAAAQVRSLAQAVAFFRAGISDYLSLPLDPAEVAERLDAALDGGGRSAAPSVTLEVEALDGDEADSVVLTFEGAAVDADEDILAHLGGDAEAPGTLEDEPEPVDGLPIPTLWDELPCGLVMFDSQGNLVFSNALALEWLGFASLGELQDALDNRRSSFAALGQNRKPLPDNQWPHTLAVKTRTARHAVLSLERPDRTRVWLRMDCLPHLSDGQVSRLGMTLINMTGEIPEPAPAAGKRKHTGKKRP